MAYAATQKASNGFTFSRAIDAVASFLASIAESNGRVREVERLNAMSDAELARRGLKREEIVRHVFRDMISV